MICPFNSYEIFVKIFPYFSSHFYRKINGDTSSRGDMAVSGETQLVVLPLHVGSPEPDGVLGVGPGEQVLGELHSSLYFQAVAVLRERNRNTD